MCHFTRILHAAFIVLLVNTAFAVETPAQSSETKAPEAKAAEAHAIGSAGFNEMLGKQTAAGTFVTEQQEDGSFLLKNTMQTVSAHITPQGVAFDSISNSAGKGGFGLQLSQWGRANNLQAADSSQIYRDGDVVFHTHTGGIAEKFSNTNDGIRQDFIVPIKPAGTGALHVQLQVTGANVAAKEGGASIQLASGRKLTYDRLAVTDSTGKTIPAYMQVAQNNVLDVVVDDATAQYPLTIDPTVGDENWVSMGALSSGLSGGVSAIAMSGSNVYVGGNFITIGSSIVANYIAKWDGSAWSTLGTGMNNSVSDLVLDSSGNLYAGGSFITAGGVLANRIAKWDGSVWSALGTGMSSDVSTLALDSSGTLYAGGVFSFAGGVRNTFSIAKWDGSAWSALGTGMNNPVVALVVDSSGTLYAGGYFTTAGGVAAKRIAKWNGSAWSALGVGIGVSINEPVRALALDSSGNLYAGGYFSTAGGVAANNIAKWNGTAWSALGTGMDNTVYTLAIGSSGTLYAGGSFNTAGGLAANYIAKWNGTAWSALGPGMNSSVRALALDSSGNFYAGGAFTTAGGVAANRIAKWNGSNWQGFGVPDPSAIGLNGLVFALAVGSNGNVYAGGVFTTAGGVTVNRIVKWDGSTWSALGTGLGNTVNALALDSSGNLYAGGDSTIAKWNGTAWSALGTGIYGDVYALALDSSGNLYAGGTFTTAGGVAANRIAKWNGSAWNALGTGMSGGTDPYVHALALDSSGNLYAGGQFTTAGGVPANNIAKWNGTAWSALGTGMSSAVSALALDSSGNLYAGGSFITAGGVAANRIAKWNGTAWSALGTGMNSYVQVLALDSSGNLYAGGSFTTAGGVAANSIAKWNGSAWNALGTGMNNNVWALALDSSGTLYVGGSFSAAGDKPSAYAAYWLLEDTDGDGVLDINDAFPNDPSEWLDTDSDGIGNNADTDDDNDGVPDAFDATPLGQKMPLNGNYKGSTVNDAADVK